MNLKQLGFGGVEWVHKKLRIKSSGGTFWNGYAPSASIKGRDFLAQLRDYHLLNKDFIPWNKQISKQIGGLHQNVLSEFNTAFYRKNVDPTLHKPQLYQISKTINRTKMACSITNRPQ
jgi:hypothetical protein